MVAAGDGRAPFAGPLKGKQLTLVPHDEVAFGTWKADHPNGRVLKPDAAVEARDDYASLDWERRMAKTRVVTTLPARSPLTPRTLIVGVTLHGRSKAYPLDALREARVLLDVVGDVPLMLAVGEDGRSVRVFDRRIAAPTNRGVSGGGWGRRPGVRGYPRRAPRADGSRDDDRMGLQRPGNIRRSCRAYADPHPVPAGVLVRLADVPTRDSGVQAVAPGGADAGSAGDSPPPMMGTAAGG